MENLEKSQDYNIIVTILAIIFIPALGIIAVIVWFIYGGLMLARLWQVLPVQQKDPSWPHRIRVISARVQDKQRIIEELGKGIDERRYKGHSKMGEDD